MIRNWLSEAKRLCSPSKVEEFCLEILDEEIDLLQRELSKHSQPVGFCHNDLQYGNIMMDEDTSSITLIVRFSFYSIFIFASPLKLMFNKMKLNL